MLPLSYAQQRLWFLSELQAEAGAIYSINAALRLEGELDRVALRMALRQLTGRQQSLRMNFRNVGGQPVIVLREPYDPLRVEDLRGLVGAEQEATIRRVADEHARQPFALADDPLLRLTLVELGADAAVLLFSIHHIIADGWSLGVLVRELSVLYAAACEGERRLAPAADSLPGLCSVAAPVALRGGAGAAAERTGGSSWPGAGPADVPHGFSAAGGQDVSRGTAEPGAGRPS